MRGLRNTRKIEAATAFCYSRHGWAKCIVPTGLGVAIKKRHDGMPNLALLIITSSVCLLIEKSLALVGERQ